MSEEHSLGPPPIRSLGNLAVIVNPAAGGVQRDLGLVERLRRSLDGRGELHAPESIVALVTLLQGLRHDGVETIAVCGGDGTNLQLFTAISNAWRGAAWPRIALLPGGSVNTGARNLGIVGPADLRLRELIDATSFALERRPLIEVNGRTGMLFGALMVARIMEAYYRGLTGPAGCVWLATRLVASSAARGPFSRAMFADTPVAITVDENPLGTLPLSAIMANVVAAPAVGLRATPLGGAGGAFHLVATQGPPTALLKQLGRLWTGLPVTGLALDRNASRLTLTAAEPLPYTLDGEMFASRRIRVETTAPVTFVFPELITRPRGTPHESRAGTPPPSPARTARRP